MLLALTVPASAQQVDMRTLSCIAHIVYGEAGNEPIEGKYRVAWSLVFRAASGLFGGYDICNVAYQYSATYNRWQYDGAKSRPKNKNDEALIESVYVAQQTLLGKNMPDKPYMYFCAPRSCGWHDHAMYPRYVDTLGGHRFYIDRRFPVLRAASAPGS